MSVSLCATGVPTVTIHAGPTIQLRNAVWKITPSTISETAASP